MLRLRMTLSTHDSSWQPALAPIPTAATNAKHFIKSSVHINQTRLPTAGADAAAAGEATSTLSLTHRSDIARQLRRPKMQSMCGG